MEPILQRKITRATGKSGVEFTRGKNESRSSFLEKVFANTTCESEVALFIDLGAADQYGDSAKPSINNMGLHSAMDMAKAIRKEREQRNRDADSDFQYLD